jgi:hypothetical protein
MTMTLIPLLSRKTNPNTRGSPGLTSRSLHSAQFLPILERVFAEPDSNDDYDLVQERRELNFRLIHLAHPLGKSLSSVKNTSNSDFESCLDCESCKDCFACKDKTAGSGRMTTPFEDYPSFGLPNSAWDELCTFSGGSDTTGNVSWLAGKQNQRRVPEFWSYQTSSSDAGITCLGSLSLLRSLQSQTFGKTAMSSQFACGRSIFLCAR